MRPKMLGRAAAAAVAVTLIGSIMAITSIQVGPVPAADATAPRDFAAIAASLEALLPTPALAAVVPAGADGVGLVDPSQGIWHLRTRDGDPASFFFGVPGDYPIMGDWDCDGFDTPGL